MNKCKGCVYWKWAKADRRHHCEKNKETTCKRRAGEKEHYRITIDVIAEPDGVDRCSDIDHVLYLNKNELVPWTVRAEDVKYKVELLSDEAEKDLGWVSVKDRLPEVGHFVLTCVSDTGTPQCVGMALLLKDRTWWDGDMKVRVDYWMEVPKLRRKRNERI